MTGAAPAGGTNFVATSGLEVRLCSRECNLMLANASSATIAAAIAGIKTEGLTTNLLMATPNRLTQ